MEEWRRAAEQIAVSQTIQGTCFLGIISATPISNSSLLARMVAEAIGRAALKTLLVTLNVGEDHETTTGVREPWRAIRPYSSRSIDVLAPHVTPQTRDLFNNRGWLAKHFHELTGKYSHIVVDLPPVIGAGDHRLMPLAAASICNAVVLMCPSGHITHAEVDQALQLLRSAEVPLIGIVVDESRSGRAIEEPLRAVDDISAGETFATFRLDSLGAQQSDNKRNTSS